MRWASALAFALAVGTTATHARADGPGSDTLGRARTAWDRGEFDSAEPLYKEALDQGGLSPKEMLDCLVHLGATRAVLGRKAAALVAFRRAALLDPRFVVPREAGKRAVTLANQARREQAKFGPFQLHAEIPESAGANKPFRVTASIDATHAALISKIGVFAHEPYADKTYEKSEPAQTNVSFEVPGTVSTPSGTVTVRVDALDAHDNRLVSVERKVRIAAALEPPVAVAPTNPKAVDSSGKADDSAWSKPVPPPKDTKEGDKKGGFWSTAWPYVIGSAALVAGGAAVYFGTRPSSDATVVVTGVR